jgi:hypothetical protein
LFIMVISLIAESSLAQAERLSSNPDPLQTIDHSSDVGPQLQEPETIVFRLSTDVLPPGGVQLANGVVVVPSDWPTIILTKFPKTGSSSKKVPTCTATLVGPNVALTAAHCVDAMLSITPRKPVLKVDGRDLKLSCEINPNYLKRDIKVRSPRGSEDYALCLLDDCGVPPASLTALRFEVVDSDLPLKVHQPVLMTGYGCSDLTVVNGELDWNESDETLGIGDERIDSAVTGAEPSPTYVTVRAVGGREPALCPGDSGGPLFTGASTAAPDVKRRVVGVNSAVDCFRGDDGKAVRCVPGDDGNYYFLSSIAATGTKIFRDWADVWIEKNKGKNPVICGLNRKPGETPCRS